MTNTWPSVREIKHDIAGSELFENSPIEDAWITACRSGVIRHLRGICPDVIVKAEGKPDEIPESLKLAATIHIRDLYYSTGNPGAAGGGYSAEGEVQYHWAFNPAAWAMIKPLRWFPVCGA